MSSAYHPQSDGQTERVNQCLETFLRCFVHACPTHWSQWLSMAEYRYNTSSHSALGRSPFEVLYGFPPRHLGVPSSSAALPELSHWLEERELMHQLVKQHLLRAQARTSAKRTSAARNAHCPSVTWYSSNCSQCRHQGRARMRRSRAQAGERPKPTYINSKFYSPLDIISKLIRR